MKVAGHALVTKTSTDLIPLCDIFVASVSSVIRFALACGKPVIDYDIHKFRYNDYLNVPGVFITESQKEYQKILHLWTSNPEELVKVAHKQRLYAKRWGILDGKAGERILALFDELTHQAVKY